MLSNTAMHRHFGQEAFNLWYPEAKKVLLSMYVIFNKDVMFHKSSSRYISDAIDFSNEYDDERQKISLEVEHMEEKYNKVAKHNNDVGEHSSPLL
jgi:hypothetical protein